MAVSRRWRFGAALLVCALVVGAAVAWKSSGSRAVSAQERPRLMLFTSLPILWNETPDLAAMLRADAPPHWARRALEARYTLVARDTLLAPPLDARFLLLAQPRPLAPQENVALDDWVRAGASAAVRRSDAHGGQHLCAGRPPPPAGHRAAFADPRALGAGTALRRGSAGGRA
jgi:hypothetical protein